MKTELFLPLFLVALVCIGSQLRAQDISKSVIVWNSSQTFTNNTSQLLREPTRIITYKSDSVNWIGADGKVKYRLRVHTVNGAWKDVSKPGSFVYEVDNYGNRGVIIIERSDGIKVHITMNTLQEPLEFDLTIESTKLLN